MFVSAYQKIRIKIEAIRNKCKKASIFLKALYKIEIFFLYFLILIITFPRYLFLGPVASFELFAQRTPSGTWLDSYTEYVAYHKVTLIGILFVIGLIIWGLIVYFLFPIFFFEVIERLHRAFLE